MLDQLTKPTATPAQLAESKEADDKKALANKKKREKEKAKKLAAKAKEWENNKEFDIKIQKKSWFCCIRQPWNSIPNNFDPHTLSFLLNS